MFQLSQVIATLPDLEYRRYVVGLVRVGHGQFQITAKGRDHLAEHREKMALLQKLADEMGLGDDLD